MRKSGDYRGGHTITGNVTVARPQAQRPEQSEIVMQPLKIQSTHRRVKSSIPDSATRPGPSAGAQQNQLVM